MGHIWGHLAYFFKKTSKFANLPPKSKIFFEKVAFSIDICISPAGHSLKLYRVQGTHLEHTARSYSHFWVFFWAKQWATSCTLDPKWTRRARLKKWKFSKCDIWSFNVVFGHFGVFYQTGHQIWPLGVHFWRLKGDWSFKKTTCRSHFWTVYSVHRWARSLISVHP